MEYDEKIYEYLEQYFKEIWPSKLPKEEGDTSYREWRNSPIIVEEYKKIIEYYGGQYGEDSEKSEITILKGLIKSMIEELEKCKLPDGTNVLKYLIDNQNATNASLNEVLPHDKDLEIPIVSKNSILRHLEKCDSLLELSVIGRFYANRLAHYYQEISERGDSSVKPGVRRSLIKYEENKLGCFKKLMVDELLRDLNGFNNGGNIRSVNDICRAISSNLPDENKLDVDKYNENIKRIKNIIRHIKKSQGLENMPVDRLKLL